MARRCFFSFHYDLDAQRASQVRQIGAIEGNRPASDNNWESIRNSGDQAIKNWIATQIQGRSCTVVLVGKETSSRKWVLYEIAKSWNDGMGVVGIRIHGLKNLKGLITTQGKNPFDNVNHKSTGRSLSSIVKCYNPPGSNSKERYDWIARNLADIVEEAVRIRNRK